MLNNPDIPIQFCLNWANESWNRSWEGDSKQILIRQEHSAEDDIDFIDSILPALRDPRYLRINGRPLLMLYRPGILPDAQATFDRWRKRLVKVGIGEPYIVIPQAFGDNDPRMFGADAAAGFPPHRAGFDLAQERHRMRLLDPSFEGQATAYKAMADNALRQLSRDYPFHPGVCPAWDNEARKPGRGRNFYGSNPEIYGRWLDHATRFALDAPDKDPRLVFINSWNEWAEGAYLEPDRHHGYAYLFETSRVKARAEAGLDYVQPRQAPELEHRAKPDTINHIVNRLRNLARMVLGRYGQTG